MDVRGRYRRAAALALLAAGCLLRAAQLPLRRYSTADGLAGNNIHQITSDARGFLWLATSEGLSRFDGYAFSNENTTTGLPDHAVNGLRIDRRGNYWLATPTGLVRFRPDLPRGSAGRITVFRPSKAGTEHINSLLEDHAGRIWCGTSRGLFTIEADSGDVAQFSEISMAMPPGLGSIVEGLAEDRDGAVWIGAGDGTLYRHLPDGRVEQYRVAGNVAFPGITELLTDRKGRIWIGTETSGLYRTMARSDPSGIAFERLSGKPGGPPAERVHALFESREGDVWVGGFQTLAQFPNGGGPARVWTRNYGLPAGGVVQITALGQDRDGNLWLGTDDFGAVKLSAGGLLTYSTADGLGSDGVISVAETLRGELFAVSRDDRGGLFVSTRDGDRFTAVRPKVPAGITYFGWRLARVILQDHTGEWWVSATGGLLRYGPLESPAQLGRVPPKAVYTIRDGLPDAEVIRLHEDAAGNIWVAAGRFVACWKRGEGRFVQPLPGAVPATAFCEDRSGNTWIGDEWGRLWRVRDSHISLIVERARRSAWISDILADHTGRLWVATSGQGLMRFDQPDRAHPQFRRKICGPAPRTGHLDKL